MKKKILVTGSNGLLGQKLIYNLLDKAHRYDIYALGRGDNRMAKTEGYTYLDADITQAEEISGIVRQLQPDILINPAAMTNVDACEKDREACKAANVLAVQYMVDALKAAKEARRFSDLANYKPGDKKPGGYNPHIIHLSTDFIFDGTSGPYAEDATPNPLSYYAESKLESEKIVMASGLKYAIVRTIIIYGVVDGNQRSNIVLWVKNSLANGNTINVITDQHRSPTLAEDLATGCIAIAERGATGVYHLSGPETFSIWDLAQKIAAYWKLDASLMKPVTSAELNQPAKRPPVTGFILDKARRDLDYNPRSFEQGLEFVDMQLKQAGLK